MNDKGVLTNDPLLIIELEKTMEQLRLQLLSDHERLGDTWIERGIRGQEHRIMERIDEYYLDYEVEGTPMPWLKIMGLCHIALVRERIDSGRA